MDYRKAAREFISRNYNVIPTTSTREPMIGNWLQFQKRQMTDEEVDKYFIDCRGIGMLCGGEWRVFCTDVDCKYDLTGDLFERVKEAIPNKILLKAFVQSTQSGGYHLVWKVPSSCLRPNEKLASRYTTPEEKHMTYLEEYADPETRPNAIRTAYNDRHRCLIETRSGTSDRCGGYFLISPTLNYKPLYGTIGELTEDEYDIVIEAMRSLNEVRELSPKPKYEGVIDWEKSPFDHYNEDGGILDILLDNGWSVVAEGNRNIRLKRPGKTMSKSSAMIDVSTNLLFVFSSGSIFECNKGYNASSVLSILSFDGDMSRTYSYLVENGFGIRK